MKKPYTFIKRSNRKYIYVRFEHLPGKEFSTGTADLIEAVVYAEAMLRKDFLLVELDVYPYSSISRISCTVAPSRMQESKQGLKALRNLSS